jgi:hypothetical protein
MSANEGSESHNYVELDDFFGGNQNLRASACPATIRFEFLISPRKLGRQQISTRYRRSSSPSCKGGYLCGTAIPYRHSRTSHRILRTFGCRRGEVALGYFSAVRRMIRRLYVIGLVWTDRRFPIGPGPLKNDTYRARRRCTRRARSMRLPRTRKPADEHCAVGRVRSQRHQSAARDRTIVFSDAPRGLLF